MSEQTVAPTTTETTTTATEGGAAPQTPTVTEGAPRNAREALARIKGGVAPSPATTSVEPKADARGNLHGEDGKFIEKQAGAEPAASAQDPTPASEGGATTDDAGGEPAPEVVKLALPEGHPLRDRGLTELPFDVPKQHEEVVRSLLNEPVRKREIAEAREQFRQATRQALEAQAEAQFWRDNSGEFFTPEFYAQYADIKNTYGDDAAERFKAGQMEAARQKLASAKAEMSSQLAAQETVATARRFRSLASQNAQTRFPGWTQPEIDRAFQAYGAWIAATGATEPKAEDWYMIATPIYEASEAGKARRAQESQRIAAEAAERAKAEAAERERQALEAAAQGRRNNPLGGVPNAQTGLRVPGGGDAPTSAKDALQRIKDRARGIA